MKKKLFLCLGTFLLVVFCLAACFGGQEIQPSQKPQALRAPQNVQSAHRVVTWEAVEHATGYVVRFENTEYETKECTLDLFFYDEPGTYRVEVMACGDGKNYLDSAWVSVEHTVQPILTHGYDDLGFYYVLLRDKIGYAVYRGKANLSGAVSMPDYFCDLPVKHLEELSVFVLGGGDQNGNYQTTSLKLPAHLESIGDTALFRTWYLEELVIPDSVEEIGVSALASCENLKKLTLPKGLKRIGINAFGNTPLDISTLPESLEEIGSRAFSWNEEIMTQPIPDPTTSIVIPDSVKIIDSGAFQGRKNLQSITISDANIERMEQNVFDGTAWYEAQPDGCIYFGQLLYKYKGEMPENSVIEITENTKVAGGAFKQQKNLKKITLKHGTKLIGEYIFTGCSALSEVILPDDLVHLPDRTFMGTTALKHIDLPQGLERIGIHTFDSSGLESIIVPFNVKEIASLAFQRCTSLVSIDLPDSLEIIGRNAFLGCKELKFLILPKSLEQIGDENGYAFDSQSFTHIYYKGNSKEWKQLSANFNQHDFKNATVYFYSEVAPIEEGNYWHFIDGKPVAWGEEEN